MSSPSTTPAVGVRRLAPGLGLLWLLAGCGGASTTAPRPGPEPGPELTVKQAVGVVRSYDAANAAAAFTLDTHLQNQHEEGVTARMDDGYFRALRLLGRHRESSTATPPTWHITVDVPHLTTTPADFVAVISLPGHASFGSGLLVLRKDSSRANWRAAYEIDLPAGPALPALAARVASPDRAAVAQVADYWRASAVRSSPLRTLAAGRFTSQLGQSFRAANAATLAQHHARETERITVDRAAPLAFRLQDGGTLVVGAIDVAFQVRQLAGSGATLVQPAGRSALPPFLAPGRYAGFTQDDIFQVALIVPASRRPIQVAGIYNELVGATGTLGS